MPPSWHDCRHLATVEPGGLLESMRMMSDASLATTRTLLRQRRPLVHNLTSAVVANFTANALLAIGASPAMVESDEEVASFAALADAVVINLGSLTPPRAEVMRLAARAAQDAGTPWVLDPVGAGSLAPRTQFALSLCAMGPTAIRGNASEIMGLMSQAGAGRGVDTTIASGEAVDAARALSARTGAIVAVTGAIDYVTDGEIVIPVVTGHPMMTRITGTGCVASAIVAACLTLSSDRMRMVVQALGITGQAGASAATRAEGPGSFVALYLDALAAG